MTQRDDSFYEIDAVAKALAVLEALEGTNFQPVKIDRIVERVAQLGVSKDFVMRALKTFRIRGWTVENARHEWTLGPGFLRLSNDFHKLCMSALEKEHRVPKLGNSTD